MPTQSPPLSMDHSPLTKGGPDGLRHYVIGDIHGLLCVLDTLLDEIRIDLARHPAAAARIISLGDLVDRGPQSREVIDRLMTPPEDLPPVSVLLGNHEEQFLAFLDDGPVHSKWMGLSGGGSETLRSYGVTPPLGHDTDSATPEEWARARKDALALFPKDHDRFLRSLPSSIRSGDLLFVHAGVDPSRSLEAQKERDFLWIREPFLSSTAPWDLFVVHGHTPRPTVEVSEARLGLDTGAYLGGTLTAAVIEGQGVRFLSVPGQRVPTRNTWG
ncbi:MAG: serine/threonine protein phosphatase [Rhodospirillum sp.]|nr:serine/threonine protein phosphatase [Rhodospirillum sp.]MCF8489865.1 serine/threonine protein phosphatase [Rhodospirillum sp.]MCF8499428.1 serine/threonine protein phosphatase [Rhodospirillum sp.]